MTEYDWSPDAAEKYIAKMEGIDRWRHDAGSTRQANPFTPATPQAMRPLELAQPKPPKRRSSSSHRRHASHSGVPPRSHTTPPQGDVYGQYYAQPQPPMPYVAPPSARLPSPLSPQGSYGHRPAYQMMPHSAGIPRPPPQRSQTYMYAMNSTPPPVRPPVRSATLPPTPYSAYPPAGGQAYYQSNPYAAGSQARLASPVPMVRQQPVIPTNPYLPYQKPHEPPLIKKMFGFLGTNSSSKKRHHSRRGSF